MYLPIILGGLSFVAFQVATSTSSLKDNFEDAQIVSSEKESEDPIASPLPSVDTKIITDKEDLFDTVAARTRYSTFKHDRGYDSIRRSSVYVNGRRICEDEDLIKNNLTSGQRRKSEEGTTRTSEYLPKRLSLPEGKALLDFEKCYSAEDIKNEAAHFVKVILEKEKTISLDMNQQHEEEEGRICDLQNTRNVICNTKKEDTRNGNDFSSDVSQSHEKNDENTNEISAAKTRFKSLEGIDERDEEIEVTSHSEDAESDNESFFDVKGEMLSLFNKLEADASFVYTIKDQDPKSTTSEDQSSNGDHSLVREMEAIFQEFKQQADENELNSSHSNSDKESDAESFFDMSKEIENIISKCVVSSEIEKSSEENVSRENAPENSPDSGSFFHIQGELESRLQNLVLHLDGSGSDEESRGKVEERLSSGEGSYFNMMDEIDLRLDLVKHGNVI
ncbi:uncharacterized protein LOC116286270 isoform X2 [Actinia tenebrosa]|uniref:Uncharacterized protein LOC116286270 isoform X2 n=1 Tax=Actinia tenebrosa TaxID=6105 RepID=A0A6P8GWF3_ACTTE|nr:uncharacterized protein LOC116286270 isoform X2 [Actinia tenebrosa]